MQFILLHEIAHAQSISLDQEWRTDLVRRAQLLGRFDSTVSFLINPVYLSYQNSRLKINNTNQLNRYLQKKGKSFLGKFGYVDLIPVQLHQQFVSVGVCRGICKIRSIDCSIAATVGQCRE
jgi:hypothetical protein